MRRGAQTAAGPEGLLLRTQPAIPRDQLFHPARLIADTARDARHQPQRRRPVIASAARILIELLDDTLQLVDRAAQALAILLRKFRRLRQHEAEQKTDDKGNWTDTHQLPPVVSSRATTTIRKATTHYSRIIGKSMLRFMP